jgi:hypothetical protein
VNALWLREDYITVMVMVFFNGVGFSFSFLFFSFLLRFSMFSNA